MIINTQESDILLDIYFYRKELEEAKSIDEEKNALENIKKAEELLMVLKSNSHSHENIMK